MIDAERVTSYDVWEEILANNPQISLVSPFCYSAVPHGKPGGKTWVHEPSEMRFYYSVEEFLPLMRIWRENEPRSWDKGQNVGGIVSIVGVGIAQKQAWRYVCFANIEDWELEKDWEPKEEKSFLFIDLEIPYSGRATRMTIKRIEEIGINGYLLRSDQAYHFISDELSSLDELPVRYGGFINAFAGDEPNWQWVRDIGNALIMAQDRRDVKQACNYILNRIGHYGEEGERWFLIDLRHIAHSLLVFPVLRVSTKEGYPTPPVLLARFKDGKVKTYFQSPALKSA
jgi:hypothetical protein